MAHQENHIAALLERAQLIVYRLRPVRPAGTQHFSDPAAMSGQEHVYHDHVSRKKKCLHLGEVFLAAVQTMDEQNAYHRFGRRRRRMLVVCWFGSCHSSCFPFFRMNSLHLIYVWTRAPVTNPVATPFMGGPSASPTLHGQGNAENGRERTGHPHGGVATGKRLYWGYTQKPAGPINCGLTELGLVTITPPGSG